MARAMDSSVSWRGGCCSQWRAVKQYPASTKSSGKTCWKWDFGAMSGLIFIFPFRASSVQRASMVDARLLKSLDGVSSKTSVADVTDGDCSRRRSRSQKLRL